MTTRYHYANAAVVPSAVIAMLVGFFAVLGTPKGQLFRRLKAARLDNSVEAEMRKLARVDLLLLDDFALQAMDSLETADFYELIVERHQKGSTVITSNRDPSEWIGVMSDPLLAQSAIDRLVATSYELVIEGQSYRRQQRPRHADNGAS